MTKSNWEKRREYERASARYTGGPPQPPRPIWIIMENAIAVIGDSEFNRDVICGIWRTYGSPALVKGLMACEEAKPDNPAFWLFTWMVKNEREEWEARRSSWETLR